MSKIVPSILYLLVHCTLSFAQLPNPSFETWNQGLPDGWFSALIPGYPVMVQSTDAHAGAYSVQLNVVNINGNPYGSSLNTGSSNGLTTPISYVPSAIDFWYKFNSIGGDQLSVTTLVYSAGNLVALGSIQLNTSSVYTPGSFNTINLSGASTADSIQISFFINNPAGATHVGSSANIDDVIAALPAGIIINNLKDDFKIGPVPAKDNLFITTNNTIKTNLTGILYDSNGKMLKTIIIGGNTPNYHIDLSDIPNGNYILQLLYKDKSITKIFSIKK